MGATTTSNNAPNQIKSPCITSPHAVATGGGGVLAPSGGAPPPPEATTSSSLAAEMQTAPFFTMPTGAGVAPRMSMPVGMTTTPATTPSILRAAAAQRQSAGGATAPPLPGVMVPRQPAKTMTPGENMASLRMMPGAGPRPVGGLWSESQLPREPVVVASANQAAGPEAYYDGDHENDDGPVGRLPQGEGLSGQRVFVHHEAGHWGVLSADQSHFLKGPQFEGRLSMVSEGTSRVGGKHRYLARFGGKGPSIADGVGFIFFSRLPCPKDIRKLTSLFLNQRGNLFLRVYQDVQRMPQRTKAIEIGDWVEMVIDLDAKVAAFQVWPADGSLPPTPPAEVEFEDEVKKARRSQKTRAWSGFFTCVVKEPGTSITFR